jgi:hypothetical protein
MAMQRREMSTQEPWISTYTTVVSKLFSAGLKSGLTPEQALDLPSSEKPKPVASGEDNYFNEYTSFIFSKQALKGRIEVGPTVNAAHAQFDNFFIFMQDMRNEQTNPYRPRLNQAEAQLFFFPEGGPPPVVKGEEIDSITASEGQKRCLWLQKTFDIIKEGYPDFTGKAEDYDKIVRLAAVRLENLHDEDPNQRPDPEHVKQLAEMANVNPATLNTPSSEDMEKLIQARGKLQELIFKLNFVDAAYQTWSGLSNEQMLYDVPGSKSIAAPGMPQVTPYAEPEALTLSPGVSSSTSSGG